MHTKTITWILLSICLLLAVIAVIIPILPKAEESEKKVNVMPVMRAPLESKQTMLMNMGHYAVITEAPLFTSTRTKVIKKKKVVFIPSEPEPISEPVIVKPPPPVEKLPRLIGIMTLGTRKRAFVLGNNDAEPVSLAVGDRYDDWTLTDINNTQIEMSYYEEKRTIRLDWALMATLYDSMQNE